MPHLSRFLRRPARAGSGLRRAASAVAAASLLALSPSSPAATRTWASGDGWFFDAARWHQNLVPGNDDDIFIGNLQAAAGATVTMGGQWGVLYGSLNLSNGVTLDTNGSELVSFGTASIMGENTRLIARPAPYLNQRDFQGQLGIGTGAHFELRDNVGVNFFENSYNQGTISGRGEIYTGTGFSNSGRIRPGNNGGLHLSFGEFADLAGNLDGSGSGQLDLTTPFSELRVHGSALTDSFSGQISMVHGSLLDMQVANGWAADQHSQITVLGFNSNAVSQIAGSHFSFGGTLSVDLAQGKLRVLAPMTVLPTAAIVVGHTDELTFQGATTVQGGSFALGRFGTMRFDGPTTLSGGTFSTYSSSYTDGTIAFNGATTWNGVVTLQGTARQQGTATVGGPFGATIHADRFDMDGLSGNTTWNVNAALVVNAQQIGTTAANRFGGTMNVAGGLLPRLTLNLANPNASWIMSGTLNLSGQSHLVETKVAGSRMVVEGQLNVAGQRVRIDADTQLSAAGFAGPAQVHIDAGAELWMNRMTGVDAAVGFSGSGLLRNASTGTLRLADGVDLDQVRLANAGLLEIGRGAGHARAHAFENLAGATWAVEIGGPLAGSGHDLLTVTDGQAVLDGLLSVRLIDLGLGQGTFLPQVGDQFTILRAAGGVLGEFDHDPISVAFGMHYAWTVLYGAHDVRLELSGINPVPEPGTWALLLAGLSATGAVARRRQARRD